MDISPLIAHFNSYKALTLAEKEALQKVVTHKKLKRRAFILSEGNICTHYTFVVKGGFKMYFVDLHGKEHNLQFAVENGWIADIESFHKNTPSHLHIEAFEPSEVFQIHKKDLLELYDNYPVFDRVFRVLVENAFVNMQHRVIQNVSTSAQERYETFLLKYPHLLNRVSNVQIASFIGVTPEFLSKIRKERVQGN